MFNHHLAPSAGKRPPIPHTIWENPQTLVSLSSTPSMSWSERAAQSPPRFHQQLEYQNQAGSDHPGPQQYSRPNNGSYSSKQLPAMATIPPAPKEWPRPSHNLLPTIPLSSDPVSASQFESYAQPQHQDARSSPTQTQSQQRRSTARRLHYSLDDWNKHRPHIKKLYLDSEMSLPETMKAMVKDFQFNPSVKQYKDKFKEWRWAKNLPAPTAQWMLRKGQTRKQESPRGKDTIFYYGEKKWTLERIEQRARQVQSSEIEAGPITAPTPNEITYETPRPINDDLVPSTTVLTPRHADPERAVPAIASWTPAPISDAESSHNLHLLWNGHTLAEVTALKQAGLHLQRTGDTQNAEKRLREAMAGFAKLRSPTDTETNVVGHQLASLYAQQDRMYDADCVLSWMGQKHVERWGLDHKKTVEHFIRVVELLSLWLRKDDALAFFTRLLNVYAQDGGLVSEAVPGPGQQRLDVGDSPLFARDSHLRSGDQSSAVFEEATSLSCQLRLVAAYARSDPQIARPLLIRLNNQCSTHLDKTPVQALTAICALVDVHRELGSREELMTALLHAKKTFNRVLESMEKKTELLLEKCTVVGKLHLREKKYKTAKKMFQRLECEAESALAPESDSMTRFFIRIGMIYQHEDMWLDAQPWFEHALAASLATYGTEATLTKRLEASLEHESFSMNSLDQDDLESAIRDSKPCFQIDAGSLNKFRLHASQFG